MNQYLIYGIGFLAQALFSTRLIVQWIVSERAHKVLSPVLFWQLSLIASFLLCLYGWLRNDFAIILGQIVTYYIYIWNLKAKDSWRKLPKMVRVIFFYLPMMVIIYFLFHSNDIIQHLFQQNNIPMGLIIFGVVGQFAFTLRFIYQWFYSLKAGESLLPLNFWIISLLGSVLIIIYAVIRRDPILLIGQSSGVIVYSRNIMIGYQAYKEKIMSAQISESTSSF